jgi:hypothetical protein
VTRRVDKAERVEPDEPHTDEPHTDVPRSGVGAGTALFAMLKKRQMRAARDTEADVQPPGTPARKTPNP